MKSPRQFYLYYLSTVLIILMILVWILPNQPIFPTIWIMLNLFLLIYLFPKVLKLPQISLPNELKNIETIKNDESLINFFFQHLNQYVLIVHADGKILQFTKPWLETFNIPHQKNLTLIELRVAAKLWSAINQGLATEKGAQFQWELFNKTFQSLLTPIHLNNSFYGVMVTAIDITKISLLEKIQSDFLADISHEIKTPLSAILGASEILNQSERKLSAKETKEFQTMIASESSRLQRLINELTDLSKIGTHGFQTLIKTKFSILNLINEVSKVHQIEMEKKHLLFKHNLPPDLQIFVDRDKFFLIFSNLLSNAIRYTDKGYIQILVEIKNKNLIINFSDSGRGIEPQNIDRIFDRFYRTDAARNRVTGGSGLGLAITRAIVQAHQGTIEVKSQLNKGTEFTLTIPHPI